MDVADHMVENVIGVFPEPLGIGVNFQINGKDYLIPMATEEPSVIAAASYAAKMIRDGGGFHTSSTTPVMIGQIQLVKIKDAKLAKQQILDAKVRNSQESKRPRSSSKFFRRRSQRHGRQNYRHHNGANGDCRIIC